MKSKAASALMIICFSVLTGYFTATYLIGPSLGLQTKPVSLESIFNEEDTEKNREEEAGNTEKTTVVQDEIEEETESGFALQYGSFSAREGAQQLADELRSQGIEADIIEMDGSFKVIGQLFDTKEEARTYMEQNAGTEDVFITQIK